MTWKELELRGWGATSTAATQAARPERQTALEAAMAAPRQGGLIGHGAGRSYGDVALNPDGGTILSARLDRILAFDPQNGEVVVEPGVTLRDLVTTFLPRGFLPPVLPGTAFVTVAGAVANDIHGKNHEEAGSFGAHLVWLDLLTSSGETRRLSPDQEPDLFAATIGGIGLTGFLRRICLRLRKVPSNAVRLRETRVSDLESLMAAFEALDDTRYSVAWIDALAKGANLGRGILETANPAPESLASRPTKRRGVPFDCPAFLLNGMTVSAFNQLYYRRVPAQGRERVLPYEKFLFPLDAIEGWNRLYGKPGFYQFQCVLPQAESAQGLRKILETIAEARAASFLSVLKRLGREGPGHLSFPLEGYTLALDFPRRGETEQLLKRLERLTLDHGGRIYLAKDALLSPEGFRAMYPKADAFEEQLEKVDPDRVMSSAMARRLKLRGGS